MAADISVAALCALCALCGAAEAEAGDEIEAFVSLSYPEGYDTASGAKPKKKAPAKKRKVDAAELDVDVEGMYKAGTLKKAKVSELKAFLFSKDVKPKGKKADLLEQVEELLA